MIDRDASLYAAKSGAHGVKVRESATGGKRIVRRAGLSSGNSASRVWEGIGGRSGNEEGNAGTSQASLRVRAGMDAAL